MKQLESLVRVLNKEQVLHSAIEDDYAREFLSLVTSSFTEKFLTGRTSTQNNHQLRVSSLGKPIVEQLLPILLQKDRGFTSSYEPMLMAQAIITSMGDWVEAIAILTARRHNFAITDCQKRVSYLDVSGRIDFILDGYVVDVKSMAGGYYGMFNKKVNDTRGYITQAAVYGEALGLPFAWLLFNNHTRMWSCHALDERDKQEALVRVNRIVPKMRAITSIEEMVVKFKAPDPVPEVFKHVATGKLLTPTPMFFSRYKDLFYVLDKGINGYNKETYYVERVRSPKEVIKRYHDM